MWRPEEVTWNLVLLQVLRRTFGVSLASALPETGEGPRWAALVEAVTHLPQRMTEVPDFRSNAPAPRSSGISRFRSWP